MHMSSFPKTDGGRSAKPLELIHSDVCGPMQVSSWGGARYLLTFTDDCTRKTFGYLMKHKSEMRSGLHYSPHCLTSIVRVMMVTKTKVVLRMFPCLPCRHLLLEEET